jgi:hypothetical protein
VFCNISAHSLLDAEFFPHFLEFMQQNQELSGSLLFEFSQSTVESAGPLELESMALLHEMGFRFSMDHVTNLDIDLQSLSDRGFRFLKVDAPTLIGGGKGAGAPSATPSTSSRRRSRPSIKSSHCSTTRSAWARAICSPSRVWCAKRSSSRPSNSPSARAPCSHTGCPAGPAETRRVRAACCATSPGALSKRS